MPLRPHQLLLLSLAATAAAYATPSGLNNIPTADTTPTKVFVLQAFSTVGGLADGDFGLGFKTGLDLDFVRFEVGANAPVYPGRGGPVRVHGKVAVPLGDHLPTIAVGAANLAFSDHQRERAGDVFGYAVATQELGWGVRVHGGAAWVDTEALPFAGIDKTFSYTREVPAEDGKAVVDGKAYKASLETESVDLFTIRGDVIAQRDSSWLYSAGVLVPVCDWFVFETWANLPDNGDSPSWTIKGNIVIKF